jgi:hypothetical protein
MRNRRARDFYLGFAGSIDLNHIKSGEPAPRPLPVSLNLAARRG